VEIDLFTFIAQIVNFLILVFLLRQLLYKRVVRAMDKREERIQSRLREAEEKQENADREAESYRKRKDELEHKKQDVLNRAEKEAEEKKKELFQQARKEVGQNQKKWREALRRQKDNFISKMRDSAGRQIYAAVRKVLNDLADEDLENQIIRFFIQRIRNLSSSRKKELRSELEGSSGTVTVVSAFEIKKELRDSLHKAVNQLFDRKVRLEYEEDPDLVCGVEIHASDQTIAWSIDSYLSELEGRLSREFEDHLPREEEQKKRERKSKEK